MIKKHPTKNEYIYATNNLWVRDFTKPIIKAFDINENIFTQQEMKILLENELENNINNNYQRIDAEDIIHENILIVSDGFDFENKHKILETLPNNITIIGVNGSWKEWNINKRMNYYVVNNPFRDCMDYLPIKLRTNPRIISSTRTNPEFLKNCQSLVYYYTPSINKIYTGVKTDSDYQIDDYRNSICAAIGLSFRFKVKKLFLLCCDDASDKEKPGMIKNNDYWIYPQQLIANKLIDANLFWLKKVIKCYDSVGFEYNNSKYTANVKEFYE